MTNRSSWLGVRVVRERRLIPTFTFASANVVNFGCGPNSRKRVVGCILSHVEGIEEEAALATRDTLCLVHIDAVSALIDLLGDRLNSYAERWGGGLLPSEVLPESLSSPKCPQGRG